MWQTRTISFEFQHYFRDGLCTFHINAGISISYLHLSVNWIIYVTYKVDKFNINMSIKSWTKIHDKNSKQISSVTPTWIVTSVPELWLQFGIYCKIRKMSCLKYWLHLFIDCATENRHDSSVIRLWIATMNFPPTR